MGPDGNTSFSAREPAVVFNGVENEYLVTWWGDDDTAPLVEGEFEIFVQRLSASGTEIGVDTRISEMGPDGNTSFSAHRPAVAFNPATNEYLVTWWGDDDTAPLVEGEREIFALLVAPPAPSAPVPPDLTPADTRAPAVRLATHSFSSVVMTLGKWRYLQIPLRCPAHETNGCTGTTTIRTTMKVPGRLLAIFGAKRTPRRVVFVKNQTFAIDGGQTKTITTRLTRENAAILRRLKKVRVQIITKAQDEAGNTRTTTTSKRILLKARG